MRCRLVTFHLDAGAKLDLILGDRGATQEADDFGIHVELFEGGSQRPDHAIVGRGAHRMGLAFGQQVQVGQLIRPIGVVVCIVAGGGIRLAARIGHALADSAAVRIGTRVGSGRGCRSRGTGGSGRSHRTGCPCERDSTGLGGTGCPRVVYRSPPGMTTVWPLVMTRVREASPSSASAAGTGLIGADGRRTKTMQWFAHR